MNERAICVNCKHHGPKFGGLIHECHNPSLMRTLPYDYVRGVQPTETWRLCHELNPFGGCVGFTPSDNSKTITNRFLDWLSKLGE